MIKDCNYKIRQLKQAYADKEMQVNRDEIGSNEVDDEAQDDKTRSMMKQKRMLQDGQKSLAQAIDYGSNIGSEMDRQKNKLTKSFNTANEITGDLGISTSLVGAIERIKRKNKMIYYAVLFLAFMFILMVVFRKLIF